MKKIRDRVVLEVVSGLLGAIPVDILNRAEFSLEVTDQKYDQMAAALFTNKNKTRTGKLLDSIANQAFR